MRYLTNHLQAKEIDRYTIQEIGIPSPVLMERAAFGVFEKIKSINKDDSNILIICGTGNNGGDGLAIARMLYQNKKNVSVRWIGNEEKGSEEFKLQIKIAKNLGVPMDSLKTDSDYQLLFREIDEGKYSVLVDAVFGIGLSRPIEGLLSELFHRINESSMHVISVDTPSGVSADTGEIMGIGVKADDSVTFGFEKTGMVFYPGSDYCGKKHIYDIGFVVSEEMKKDLAITYGPEDLKKIPKRKSDGNKGTFGHVLVIAGSVGMNGAAYMCAKAAYRTGAGLVRIFTVKDNVSVLQTLLPEAIITGYDECDLTEDAMDSVLKWADHVLIGPGLSTEAYAKRLLTYVLTHCTVPMVIDADGLNILSENPELLKKLNEHVIVTPHMGEMSRLMKRSVSSIKQNPVLTAKTFYEDTGAICVLKNSRTVVYAGDKTYINTSGNSGMATGGSGDVLCGIIGGLLAIGMEPEEAARMGVYLHGLAGDLSSKQFGNHGMLATDLIEQIPNIMNSL